MPNYGGLTFSGCGHLSPLQNDPELVSVGVGTGLLFNGAEGFVVSTGTRCSPKYPNLMTVADMKEMDPVLMGGFRTAAGPEVLTTYAIPIPVLNPRILKHTTVRDRDILDQGLAFDLVVLDPPSYATTKTSRFSAAPTCPSTATPSSSRS